MTTQTDHTYNYADYGNCILHPTPDVAGCTPSPHHFRLCNSATNLCIYTSPNTGTSGPLYATALSDSTALDFVISAGPSGEVYLHHVLSGRCIYVDNTNFTPYTWACWGDPNMRFGMDVHSWTANPVQVALHHMKTGRCLAISGTTVVSVASSSCQSNAWYLSPVTDRYDY